MDTISQGIRTIPINELKPHPDNPRIGDVQGIAQSLNKFGQVRPIVVLPDYTILAGKHTWQAAKDLAWDQIDAVVVNLPPDEAKAYLITDNRLADKATYDDATLMRVLDELNSAGLLEVTGFSLDDLEDLTSAIEGVRETAPEPFSGGYAEPEEATAERWAGRNEGQRREVVFLLMEEEFEQFRTWVDQLRNAWHKESMADTIYAAVEYAKTNGITG